jgi:hypothetical protein
MAHLSRDEPYVAIARESLRLALLQQARYRDPTRLAPSGAKYFSQGDEDGIIAEVFRRIGVRDRFFVEIGVGDGSENNTLHLLLNGWRGVWIDAWEEGIARAREQYAPLIGAGKLAVIHANASPGNVAAVLRDAGVATNFDLLSIDIDGNDFHVFEAMGDWKPRVAVLEYNASFGPTARWVMPFSPAHRWDETLVFGASLAAITGLANSKGLDLVGCNLPGTNAFFVAGGEDLASFKRPFTPTEHYEPPRYFLLPMAGGHAFPPATDARLAEGRLD